MTANIVSMDPGSIQRGAEVVRLGGLIVYPTDTVYGLGCDPSNEDAVRKVFEAKGRTSKPIPVLCSSREKAEELVELSSRAKKLVAEHWPGPLTIVAPLKRKLPALLTQESAGLGVRVPSHEGCLRLISACGGWLTGTSANLSGNPSARTASEASRQLGQFVDLIFDGGKLAGTESTVVRVVGDEVSLLRTGPIGVGDGMKARRTS